MKKILTSFACMALLVACSDKSANYDELFGNGGAKSVKLTLKDGKFTDSRDGQKYSVVAIGGMIWMAENLRYADSSKTPNLKGNMWCLENEKAYCEEYGPLYSWTAAMNLDEKNASSVATYSYDANYVYGVRGICPDGWRLPTNDDWSLLGNYWVTYIIQGGPGGADFKSLEGWEEEFGIEKPLNRSGFNAYPAGRRNSEGGNFMSFGKYAYFWTSNQVDAGTSIGWALFYNNNYLVDGEYYKDHGMSVRCILDASVSSGVEIEGDMDSSFLDAIPFDYGKMEIDGRSYKTIQIGTQNWMAENVAVKTEDSWCYNDDSKNCDKYGRLYSFEKAMTVCPDGWRLPTEDDFNTLQLYVQFGGNLRSRDGWTDKGKRGLNLWGFNALPAGGYEKGDFFDVTYTSYMWGANQSVLSLRYYDDKISVETKEASNAFSVRCIEE